jgi:hypothetical protein
MQDREAQEASRSQQSEAGVSEILRHFMGDKTAD